jgi:hypothetical protein
MLITGMYTIGYEYLKDDTMINGLGGYQIDPLDAIISEMGFFLCSTLQNQIEPIN